MGFIAAPVKSVGFRTFESIWDKSRDKFCSFTLYDIKILSR